MRDQILTDVLHLVLVDVETAEELGYVRTVLHIGAALVVAATERLQQLEETSDANGQEEDRR